MKTNLLFLKFRLINRIVALAILISFSNQSFSQTPQYYNYNTAGSPNSFPLNQTAGKKTQWLYHPGDFNQPTAAPSGSILSLALRINETYPLNSTTYSNFTIRLGQSSVTTFTTGNFYSGTLDTVYYRASVTFSCAGGQWLNIPLDSAFNYNPSLSLVVEISQCSAPGASGFSICQSTFPENRRIYSNAGCPFTYGNSVNTSAHIGFNMCAAVSPSNTTVAMNQMICSGDSTTLSASGSGVLSWFNSSTGGSYLGGGSTLNTPILTTNTTYYVQDSAACGVSLRTPITVTVNALPSVSISASPAGTICAGQSVTLTANGADTYAWNPGPSGTSIVVTPSVTTSYTAIGTASVTGCSGSNNITVNVATCTGIIEATSSVTNLEFYPNPSDGNFTMVVDVKSNVSIINFLGQEIAKYELVPGKNQINLSNVSNGVYFIKVSNKNYNKTLRMIKE